ncbi:MAG: glutathione S-transferase [Gammaproteobacteria bacterium]|nr:glutathione S-transferase [Gammaproteobacteria bacterium]
MKLLWSSRSPFARKVCIALHELKIDDQVERVPCTVISSVKTPKEVLSINPLGKIPALQLNDGTHLYDSRVICEYLDLTYGPTLYPSDNQQRIRHLKWQSLADGIQDALLLWRSEIGRGEQCSNDICSAFEHKIRACFIQMEADAISLSSSVFGIGHISIMCALDYFNFRWSGSGWETTFPTLSHWHAGLSQRDSLLANPFDDNTAVASTRPAFQF